MLPLKWGSSRNFVTEDSSTSTTKHFWKKIVLNLKNIWLIDLDPPLVSPIEKRWLFFDRWSNNFWLNFLRKDLGMPRSNKVCKPCPKRLSFLDCSYRTRKVNELTHINPNILISWKILLVLIDHIHDVDHQGHWLEISNAYIKMGYWYHTRSSIWTETPTRISPLGFNLGHLTDSYGFDKISENSNKRVE